MEPRPPSVETTRIFPSSEACTSPSVPASDTMTESRRTGVSPVTSHTLRELPRPLAPRRLQVPVYAQPPRTHSSEV